jgi:hypothetical protein
VRLGIRQLRRRILGGQRLKGRDAAKLATSSPAPSASFFHWALIDRQARSGSFIGGRRMINQQLTRKVITCILRVGVRRLLTAVRRANVMLKIHRQSERFTQNPNE